MAAKLSSNALVGNMQISVTELVLFLEPQDLWP